MNEKKDLLKRVTRRLQISCSMADAIIDTIIEMDAEEFVIQFKNLKKTIKVNINTETI